MELLENGTEYLKDFVRLNEEWISRFFELEASDIAFRDHPFGIVEEGGYIFTLVDEGEVLGVCALLKRSDDVYELAKMAVEPKHQGKKYAHRLMQAVLEKLNQVNARSVYLYSNTMLDPAVNLYKQYGFETQSTGQQGEYKRANIKMQKVLTPFDKKSSGGALDV